MSKRQDVHEEWAIALLSQIVDLDRSNRDALPGSAVGLVKQARMILVKRRRRAQQRGEAGAGGDRG